MSNPLVADAIDTATPFSGAGILDSGEQLAGAIRSGDWVQGTVAGVGVALDTAATVIDPLGSLIGAGLGWLIDHLEPLKGWFNDFTGDAGQVAAFGQTWANISDQLEDAQHELNRILADVDHLHGETIDAYVRFQRETAQHLGVAASWADAMSTGLQVAGTIVQIVHDVVRDVLSQLVGSIISWAAEAIFTLGLATPAIVAQVSTRVASLATKVGRSVTDALSSCKALARLLDQLSTLMRHAADVYATALRKTQKAVHNAQEAVIGLPGIRRLDPRRTDLIDNMTRWADDANIPGYKPFGNLTPTDFIDTHLKQFDQVGRPWWRFPLDDGFDPAVPRVPANQILKPGDEITRISVDSPVDDTGKFAAPKDTSFTDLSLPPDRLGPDYGSYTLRLKPGMVLPDEVVFGRIAPGFEQRGKGLQYFFPGGINKWLDYFDIVE
ncbi:TNT domain-containing protein [Microbacterium sp.]|uniref:TNT domain-containing protein n=1 Tax=Microbacterium sp. TaxID=51671 RepID=UPI0039E6212C